MEDVDLTRSAFRRCQIYNPIRNISTGEKALAYLLGTGIYANRAAHPLPVLILLDLELPRMNGLEVLRFLGPEMIAQLCPIIILSGTADLKALTECYRLGATSFLTKPIAPEELNNLVHEIPKLGLQKQPLGYNIHS